MMPSLASSVLTSVADAAVRALVFAGVMGLALTVFRVTGAAARLWAWTIVLIAALSMPLIGRAVPGLRWTIPTFGPIARLLAVTAPATPAGVSAGAAARVAASGATAPQPRRGAAGPAFWLTAALMAYVSGVLLLLARAAMRWRATRDLARSAHVVRDADARDRLRWHAAVAGLARVPVLTESSALRVPVAMSVVTPTIVLPRTWREWSPARLDAVLAHELAHIARRDTLIQRLSLLYRAMAWFNPLSWWLHHRLADLAEQASDDAALAAGGSRTDYAETLLAFLGELQCGPQRAGWHVAMARGAVASAERRMERILSWRGDRSMRLRKRFMLGVALVAVPVAVLIAAVHVALAQATVPALAPAVAATAIAPPSAVPAAQSSTQATTYKPGSGVTDPMPVRSPEPKYTAQAVRAHIQGVVLMKIIVLPDGTVGDVLVTQSLDAKSGLDQEAVKAAKQWKFKPSTKDGKPVPVEVTLEMTFRLKDSPGDRTAAPTAPAQAPGTGGGTYRPGAGVTSASAPAPSQTPEDEFVKGAYPSDTPGLTPPKVTHAVEPKYTSNAMRAKIQGEVVVQLVVDTDGSVLRSRVIQSLDKDYGLDEEALNAANRWTFEPATLNKDKVPALATIRLTFRLH